MEGIPKPPAGAKLLHPIFIRPLVNALRSWAIPIPSSPTSYVGVCDIGGTRWRVALADCKGNLIAKKAEPYLAHSPQPLPDDVRLGPDPRGVVETIARELEALARAARVELSGVGVSVPGPLDAQRGVICFSPNLGWREFPLARELSARLNLPVVLDDDANCGALGEHWLGSGRGARDFVYIVVGTGIGGGLVLNGRLYRGAGGGAGEIGHTTILPEGPLCSCGNRGCLEALAAGPAWVRRARELGAMYKSAREVIAAARQGEERAQQVLTEAGRFLGIGLANVVNMLNPERIALGGGVALDAGELLLAPACAEMERHAFASLAAKVRVTLAALGDDAGLIGAARLILGNVKPHTSPFGKSFA